MFAKVTTLAKLTTRTLRKASFALIFAGVLAGGVWAGGGTARAQAGGQLGISTGTGNGLNIEHYHPSLLGLSSVEMTRAQRWREWSLGVFVHYARNPLVLYEDRLQVGEVVGHRLSADLVGSLGLLDWLDATFVLPFTPYQVGDGNLPTGDLAAAGLRDFRLQLKAQILRQQDALVGVAIVPELGIPVGTADAFLGDGKLSFSPQLLVDRTLDVLWGFRAGVGAGVRLRPRAEIGNIEIDDEIFYRAGVGVGLPNFWDRQPEAIAEVSGVSRLDNLFKRKEQNALLGTLAMRMTFDLEPGHQILGIGGVTLGATHGYGSPDVQVFVGAIYRRYLSDRDGDGIADVDDLCPDDPEDFDGFEDADGCPEPDNDKDGIPDVSDACPEDPEDIDQFQDLDGCPDLDNDKDGIPDAVDRCPLEPEDFDGFKDDDGCPEPDNDKDGIPDGQDRCPEEKETINGIDDEDGCPDEGEPHVEVTSEKVTIDTKIMFDFDSARIRPESYGILNQVSLTLQANMQLQKVRVEGHTDERGSDDYNLLLSQRRAESVMRYLVQRGVNPKRLEAVGYGEQRPIAQGHDEAAWAKNRRVEFTILDQQSVEEGPRDFTAPEEASPPTDGGE
ncbi:MAG: OmpA family protein [Deltaproteobacteria bacterium]|nr:OmpA family protein [Deltaproteobacteria bacterium]